MKPRLKSIFAKVWMIGKVWCWIQPAVWILKIILTIKLITHSYEARLVLIFHLYRFEPAYLNYKDFQMETIQEKSINIFWWMKFSDGLAVEVECRSNRGELGQLDQLLGLGWVLSQLIAERKLSAFENCHQINVRNIFFKLTNMVPNKD